MGLYDIGSVKDVERARQPSAEGSAPAAAEVETALRKVGRRLIPLCMGVAIANHMDRSNLAYAALTFNRDLGFDGRVYALGTALFYAAFMLCMVPSNLVMVRVGLRSWLGFLLIAWGVVAACFSLVRSAWSFYLLRALLGIFEAGAFPACWHALTLFYPRSRITKPFAYLTIGTMVAQLIGSPIAAGLLSLDGVGGIRGWQWMFGVEGIPSVLLGACVFAFLPSSIAGARFLTQPEREALAAEVARNSAPGPAGRDLAGALVLLRMTVRNTRLWGAFLCGALSSIASHTYMTYTPILISNLLSGTALTSHVSVAAAAGTSSLLPVALAVVPYSLASAAAYAVAASAQRRNEHFFHVSISLALSGTMLALFAPLARASVAGGFVALSLSLAMGAAANGPATALVSRLCKGPEQVVALPLFSSFAVLGGVAGPLMAGAVLNTSGGFTLLTIIMGSVLLGTAALVFGLRFYVMATGGIDSAVPTKLRLEDDAPPSPSSALCSGNALCVVLGRDSPRALAARSPKAPGSPGATNA
ncbi:MFS transporter [Raphidocelis subcapitata]|uniref:MFS transporter n=1 Tax=Raphidocelis subcapitata TaxID=307507 RepID=A0A2V0PR31_9CHLO|nr:MFS transporter [Raphidocelis subcapitata]|eukprot:GBF99705.1 MFS transporter [Raphidocelis subcapitata]